MKKLTWRAKRQHNSNLKIWRLREPEDDAVILEIVITDIGRGTDLGRRKKDVVLDKPRLRTLESYMEPSGHMGLELSREV